MMTLIANSGAADNYALPGLLPTTPSHYLADVIQRRFTNAPSERLKKIFGFNSAKFKVWKSRSIIIVAGGSFSFINKSEKMFTRYRNPFSALIGLKAAGQTAIYLENSQSNVFSNSNFSGGSLAILISGNSSFAVNQCALNKVGGFTYSIELVFCIQDIDLDELAVAKNIDLISARIFAMGGF